MNHLFFCFFIVLNVSTGVSIPRQANDGTFLPSARDISLAVHKDVDNPHLHLTAMAAIWGQLVHNDISHTPQMAGEFSIPFRLNHVILIPSPSFFPLPRRSYLFSATSRTLFTVLRGTFSSEDWPPLTYACPTLYFINTLCVCVFFSL